MRNLNKILGFVAVSFVLVFLGKINKVDLYRAYFKTIADVGVRNTQGLDAHHLRLHLTSVEEVQQDNGYVLNIGNVHRSDAIFLVSIPIEPTPLQPDQDFVYGPSLHFQSTAPIRGPGRA